MTHIELIEATLPSLKKSTTPSHSLAQVVRFDRRSARRARALEQRERRVLQSGRLEAAARGARAPQRQEVAVERAVKAGLRGLVGGRRVVQGERRPDLAVGLFCLF